MTPPRTIPVKFRINGVERPGYISPDLETWQLNEFGAGQGSEVTIEDVIAQGLIHVQLENNWDLSSYFGIGIDQHWSAFDAQQSLLEGVVPFLGPDWNSYGDRVTRFPQPDAAIIIVVDSVSLAETGSTKEAEGVYLGHIRPFDVARRLVFRYNRYSLRPGSDPTWDDPQPHEFDRSVYEDEKPRSLLGPIDISIPGAAKLEGRLSWCEADPTRTGEAAKRWRDAAQELRGAAVDVTDCIRLAEASWDSSHSYPQFLQSARAERRMLWDLADALDSTAKELEGIRDDQQAAKDAERDFYDDLKKEALVAVFMLAFTAGFGMLPRVGRAAVVVGASNAALARLATSVTSIAAAVRMMPVYLRVPISFAAWGAGGAANYAASDTLGTLIVRRRFEVLAADDLGLAFVLSAFGGTALSELLRARRSLSKGRGVEDLPWPVVNSPVVRMAPPGGGPSAVVTERWRKADRDALEESRAPRQDANGVLHPPALVLTLPRDHLGRPQGALGTLTRTDALLMGSSANRRILPPGWGRGGHAGLSRSHLIARMLGGSGLDRRNLVAFPQSANRAMANFEAQIRKKLLSGSRVDYRVTPIYRGENLKPTSISIEAWDSAGGWYSHLVIP